MTRQISLPEIMKRAESILWEEHLVNWEQFDLLKSLLDAIIQACKEFSNESKGS